MKTNRRQFLQSAGFRLGTAAAAVSASTAGCGEQTPKPAATPTQSTTPPPSPPASPARLRLGMVTYNLAKDWDVPTIIKNCEAAGFAGVELRTSQAHKVEVGLTKEQREEVRDRFANSKVQLMGLGSAFDFHTPDQARLRKDIEATKEYIVLAHDVGATGIKVRPNGFPPGVPQDRTLEQIGRSLRELAEYSDAFGIQIRLEVHGTGTSLLPNIRKIMDAADHPLAGVCWNSNQTDLGGDGFDHNFDLVKNRIFTVHLRDLYLEEYPFRKLFARLSQLGDNQGFTGWCLAEIPESTDAVRVMKYFRGLFLAYQGLL